MIFIILLKISNLQNILGVKKARRNGLVADRGGFEPPIRYERIHAFQACAFNHSATCPVWAEKGNSQRHKG